MKRGCELCGSRGVLTGGVCRRCLSSELTPEGKELERAAARAAEAARKERREEVDRRLEAAETVRKERSSGIADRLAEDRAGHARTRTAEARKQKHGGTNSGGGT